MESAANKSERLVQLEQILLSHPHGLRKAEIARKLGVNRSTVGRYIDELSSRHSVPVPIYEENGIIKINRDKYLNQISLTIHEAMAVHLATRLMATRTDKHNPYAASALRKLGQTLETFAPLISQHLLASANVMDDVAQRHDPNYLHVLLMLTNAWASGEMVHLWHKHEITGKVFEYDFAPYFIEPYAVGQTIHVIGWRKPPGEIRTFKIERIQRIEPIKERYTIPTNFNPQEILADAWGIWYTEAEPIEVVLKFHPRVAGRIRETRWHRSEDVTDLPDGHLLWRAKIAEPQEMIPWIRGWGSDVEVLEPEKLRKKLEQETRRLMKIYGLKMQPSQDDPLLPFDDPARLLWAKTNRYHGRDYGQDYDTHPLICHLIDVSQVVCALWNHHLPQATRRYFSQTLNIPEEDTRQWLAFLAGLHDLGKACPVFQVACEKELPQVVQQLREAGFIFQQADSATHGLVSACSLKTLFQQELGLEKDIAHTLAVAIGGHHGTIITSGNIRTLGPRQYGKGIWETARLTLFCTLAKSLELHNLKQFTPPLEQTALNTFTMALAGLISFADWLGSMSEHFSFVETDDLVLTNYVETAYRQATDALQQLGWLDWSPPQVGLPFKQLFPFSPRPLQEATVALADEQHVSPPALVIVEAPTGEGKTEAAWYLADRWLAEHQQRGIYVAMPTQATSNQMLSRVKKFIKKRYPDNQTPLLLLHGDAIFSKEMQEMKLAAIGDKPEETVVAHAWFLPKKRSLLAPFAVGTVDQSLLAVLQTRHFFVRLFGLSHKTVIFDEVHAYDTYMNTLLCRLLAWLRRMGTSVILLSATLPSNTRQTLIEAYGGKSFDQDVPYPAITWASEVSTGVIPIQTSQSHTVSLKWITNEPDMLTTTIRQGIDGGGCVAVLCNTVGQAQTVFRQLAAENLVSDDDLILFHARFPFNRRQEIEKEVIEKFGKPEEGKPDQRPQKAIVIATQVIEQSLDLDFDLMISYLAPIDLILQRAGRLHRHNRPRPNGLETPRLVLVQPDMQDDIPQFGVDRLIYAPYILLRTYLALQNTPDLHIPEDVQPLIEQVYGDDPLSGLFPAWESALAEAKTKLDEEVREQENKARGNLIYPPEDEDLFWEMSKDLDEDNPELHQALRALTRLTRPTVTLVCLHQTDQGIVIDPEVSTQIDLKNEPDYDLARKLASRKVSLTNRTIVNHFVAQLAPNGWQNHPMLRYFRPIVFVNNIYVVNQQLSLRFDSKQGIIIEKEDA